ncbi:hypothetical protein EJ05DRAFT_484709 [Pseudovirgaria hyperparasitica]|uniref:Uncharacterized protein n=1 Tax=Pseudovirgaria hyperparasitica TaxID=470096 RepID=A0A6A6WCM6_9PEZI|nr:uncharacterized protein EJ05DRAFT_484709 [Pseudovirgaria hyperparasitica]KAF2759804.1 hypothetical protein EJ05DRAFT_484709 [Pseudovirgaria hyperparasitica]
MSAAAGWCSTCTRTDAASSRGSTHGSTVVRPDCRRAGASDELTDVRLAECRVGREVVMIHEILRRRLGWRKIQAGQTEAGMVVDVNVGVERSLVFPVQQGIIIIVLARLCLTKMYEEMRMAMRMAMRMKNLAMGDDHSMGWRDRGGYTHQKGGKGLKSVGLAAGFPAKLRHLESGQAGWARAVILLTQLK